MRVELDEREWQQVISILAGAPWNVANPLLMKIGNQLRARPTNSDSADHVPPPSSADEEIFKQ